MPSVLIVDDESDTRFLVRQVVEVADAWCVAGEAASVVDALERFRETQPDIVVPDQRMPAMTGLETAALILAENPAQAIVLFTAVEDPASRSRRPGSASAHASPKRSLTIWWQTFQTMLATRGRGPDLRRSSGGRP